MLFIFIVCMILYVVQSNTLSNPELLSTYPFKDEYVKFLRESENDLDTNCPGFKCDSSGLKQVHISDLVNKENEIRDRYAIERNITNIYAVSWNPLLAFHAQGRNPLGCVLPATGRDVIYESVSNQWNIGNDTLLDEKLDRLLESYPTAVEVAMASRVFPIEDRTDLRHSVTEFIEMFNKIDNTSNPLERRGGTVDMGCSYLVTANTTHNTDYMVCLYGFLYFDPINTTNKYSNNIGTPCSRCTFYTTFKEIPETIGQWTCGNRYPHICNNLSKRNAHEAILKANEFHCSPKLGGLKKMVQSPLAQDVLSTITATISMTNHTTRSGSTRKIGIFNSVLILSVVLTLDT